jgi:hypothetical protein
VSVGTRFGRADTQQVPTGYAPGTNQVSASTHSHGAWPLRVGSVDRPSSRHPRHTSPGPYLLAHLFGADGSTFRSSASSLDVTAPAGGATPASVCRAGAWGRGSAGAGDRWDCRAARAVSRASTLASRSALGRACDPVITSNQSRTLQPSALARLRQSANTSGGNFRLICSSGTGYGAGIETVPTGTGRYHPRQPGQPAKGMRQVRRSGPKHHRALRWVRGQQGSQQGAQGGGGRHRQGEGPPGFPGADRERIAIRNNYWEII